MACNVLKQLTHNDSSHSSHSKTASQWEHSLHTKKLFILAKSIYFILYYKRWCYISMYLYLLNPFITFGSYTLTIVLIWLLFLAYSFYDLMASLKSWIFFNFSSLNLVFDSISASYCDLMSSNFLRKSLDFAYYSYMIIFVFLSASLYPVVTCAFSCIFCNSFKTHYGLSGINH